MSGLASQSTSSTLVKRLQDVQDGDAWQTFVDVYGPLICRYCRRRGLQEADAADVTQEVLAQVVRSIRTFEYQPERGRFRDWLGTVARGKLVHWCEKRRPEVHGAAGEDSPDLLAGAAGPGSEAEWTADFHAGVLQAALARIRPHFEAVTWRAFERTWLDNRPAADAAGELGLPVAAVYVAKSRVLKRLRDEVLHLAEDLPQLVPLS
jgi:RNA polymerase sigma-70 factor (ECF subfamily)